MAYTDRLVVAVACWELCLAGSPSWIDMENAYRTHEIVQKSDNIQEPEVNESKYFAMNSDKYEKRAI